MSPPREEPPRTMRDLALSLGLPARDVDRATADGTLGLLSISSFIFPGAPIYTTDEAMELTSLGERAKSFWRALGFPDPPPGEKAFTQADIDVLNIVRQLLETGVVEEDVALQMARVIGVSMARIAAAPLLILSGKAILAVARFAPFCLETGRCDRANIDFMTALPACT